MEYWVDDTVTLDGEPDTPLGMGWAVDGQQRVYDDEAGHILITDGTRHDAFFSAFNNLVRRHNHDGVLVWTNYGSTTVQAFPESLARQWIPAYAASVLSLDVGDEPYTLVLSEDGKFAYVAAEGQEGETLPVVNLRDWQVPDAVTVGYQPASVALSPDGQTAYVAHWGNNELAVVDLVQRTQVGAIPLDGTGWSDLAVSPDSLRGQSLLQRCGRGG